MPFRSSVAQHFQRLANVSREDIFGEADAKYLPVNLVEDASTMFAGYVGRSYEPGQGVMFFAINPGGGGDAYQTRKAEDEILYPLLKAFKNGPERNPERTFEQINDTFVEIVKRWSLWRILGPTLDAAGKTIDEVAYMNVISNESPPVAGTGRARAGSARPRPTVAWAMSPDRSVG